MLVFVFKASLFGGTIIGHDSSTLKHIPVQVQKFPMDLKSALELLQNCLWMLANTSNFVLTLSITFFLGIYTACLSIIKTELENVVKKIDGLPPRKPTGEDSNIIEILIGSCLQAYNVLEDIIKDFDRHFTLELILIVLFSVLITSLQIFFVIFYFFIGKYINALWIGLYAMICTYQIYYLTSHCSSLDGAIKAVLDKLYCIDSDKISKHLFMKVSTMTLKLSTNAPTISPGQFFKVDRHLITSILAAITTYIVILIQFEAGDGSNGGTAWNDSCVPTIENVS
ncbi:unnamed protein product [Allacma fusca]|uniref:Gustatory receptor n=1 Tax=Allacma fusca TaxID=39272 RepID=A0A8J2J917_9HEXA|nr:unnamed protein product [Allacma fusca]